MKRSSSGGSTNSPGDAKRRPAQSRGMLQGAPCCLLPIAVLLFAVMTTGLIALWALSNYAPVQPKPTPSQKQHMPFGVTLGGSEAASGASGAAAAAESSSEAAADPLQAGVVYAAPFLSDLLPESPSSRARRKPLTPEEEELAKAEAKYKSNIIRRTELMEGVRPPYPYRKWNAGRLREVFLSALYPCPHPQKLGSDDRGKWLCNPDKFKGEPVTIFSFGSLEDLSFEAAAVREFGPRTLVHAFTPTLNSKEERKLMGPKSEARQFLASFQPIGVAAKDGLEAARASAPPGKEMLTFPQILARMEKPTVDIVKMDCEGCETTVIYEIGQTYKRSHPPFSQIIVEIHHARQPTRTLPVLFALEDLGFRLFHVEAEKHSTQRYELSFVHERFLYNSSDAALATRGR